MAFDKATVQAMMSSLALDEKADEVTDTLVYYAEKLGFGHAWSDELGRVVFPWDFDDWDKRDKE